MRKLLLGAVILLTACQTTQPVEEAQIKTVIKFAEKPFHTETAQNATEQSEEKHPALQAVDEIEVTQQRKRDEIVCKKQYVTGSNIKYKEYCMTKRVWDELRQRNKAAMTERAM